MRDVSNLSVIPGRAIVLTGPESIRPVVVMD
jgi:hypothetical protein